MLHTRGVLLQFGEQVGQCEQVRGTKVQAAPRDGLESVRDAQVGPSLGEAPQGSVRASPDNHRRRPPTGPLPQFESLPPQWMERMRYREAPR